MIKPDIDRTELKVLVVEDEPAIAKSVATSLKRINYQISALAFDDQMAIDELAHNPPDIILLDINLNSKMDGIDLANLINEKYRLPFIFLTSYATDSYLERAKKTHPMGYLLKPFTERDLYTSLEIGLYNYSQRFLPQTLSLTLLNQQLEEKLTKREFDVLLGIYNGQTNDQLAESLFVSPNTVKTHVKNLFSKVDVTSRWELLIALRKLF